MSFKHLIIGCLALVVLGLATCPVAHAQQAPPSEYQLKAAFLYNFAKFVEWPPEAFPDPATPFTIGIIGQDPFSGDLERTVKAKTARGHPFAIKQIKSLSELKTCQILFVCASERKRLPDILTALGDASVLTVSELERFMQSGGMINFLMEGHKVRFEINDAAARRVGLRISSKLLSLAGRTAKEGEK